MGATTSTFTTFESMFVGLLVFFLRAPDQRYSVLYMWCVLVYDVVYGASQVHPVHIMTGLHRLEDYHVWAITDGTSLFTVEFENSSDRLRKTSVLFVRSGLYPISS